VDDGKHVTTITPKSGLSMVDVATRTGIPVRDIAAAEHGLRPLDANQIAQLSKLYRITVKQLIRLPKPNKAAP
jgi:transcriptional regulator with XRE-family HTH domain